MRANPFQIIVLAALSGSAPAAFAHAHRPAAHAAATKPAKKSVTAQRRSSEHETAHKGRQKTEKVALVKHLHTDAPKLKRVLIHGKWHRVTAEPVVLEKPHTQRHHEAPEPAPKYVARVAKAVPAAVHEEDSAPVEAARPELAPIHVTHDRKQHYAPAASEPDADESPRKATPADFLTTDAPAANSPAARPAPVQQRASPTAGVTVGARVELKPSLLPVKQLAPEPLVSLVYDRRGRLVVPAPMKGSHEVLIHQNVMANSDGLERVQDDEDLLRMRSSRMLVALPENDGIQTDDRLPTNRRFARPWTVSFLTTLARAHYARFHTPLQVNSAVRTVEFQVRLQRINGNAAPAEGETASPHLTGQAIDIAKHGLSLTEIAWLRGYLLPLVQEGRVDVEEEFQQACFHISVYRKYMPQAAEGRTIAEGKRRPGATLAIVLP